MEKNKKLVLILITLILFVGMVLFSFKLGEKRAYSKVSEVSLRGSMKFDEETQEKIIQKANEYVKENSVEGMKFVLVVSRTSNNWIVFNVYPLSSEIDTAQLFVEYVNNEPVFHGLGTSFPGLEESHPE